MDVQRRVYLRIRRAVMVEGMTIREAYRMFGLHRDTVSNMSACSVPPSYRRQIPRGKHKLKPPLAASSTSWKTTIG